MFVILNPVETVGGYFERRRQAKAFARSEPSVFRSRSGLPFFLLNVPCGKNGIDWETTAAKCGRYASRIIAPRDLTIPDIRGLRRFVPARLPAVLTLNTAVAVLNKASLESDRFSLTLCDRNAYLPAELSRLLPLSATVRVVTNRPERYARACADAFENYGASVLLRQRYEPTAGRDIAVCADGCTSPDMENSAIFLYSKRFASRLCFTCGGLELLPEHRGIIPSGVDPADFAGALSELCGSGEYSKAVCPDIEIGGRDRAEADPAACLRGFIVK